jgi:hypothetical protein
VEIDHEKRLNHFPLYPAHAAGFGGYGLRLGCQRAEFRSAIIDSHAHFCLSNSS